MYQTLNTQSYIFGWTRKELCRVALVLYRVFQISTTYGKNYEWSSVSLRHLHINRNRIASTSQLISKYENKVTVTMLTTAAILCTCAYICRICTAQKILSTTFMMCIVIFGFLFNQLYIWYNNVIFDEAVSCLMNQSSFRMEEHHAIRYPGSFQCECPLICRVPRASRYAYPAKAGVLVVRRRYQWNHSETTFARAFIVQFPHKATVQGTVISLCSWPQIQPT